MAATEAALAGGERSPAAGPRSRVADVGVLVLTVEGLQQSLGGVGRYVRNLAAEAPAFRAALLEAGARVTFHAAEPRLATDDPSFDERLWADARSAFEPGGGTLARLDAGPGGWAWDSFPAYEALGRAAARRALELVDRHDSLVVLSGTSAFGLAPAFVLEELGPHDGRVVCVHTHGAALPAPEVRPATAELAADSAVCVLARNDRRVRIAYISEFMRRVFTCGYGVPDGALLPNVTGIRLADPRFAARGADACERRLEALGIPTDRPLVFAWGRNSATGLDKGYDLLLRACARLDRDVVPVLMLRGHDTGLCELALDLGVEAVVLDGQGFDAIASVLQWPRTACAVFAADSDPGAAAPLEAMWTAARSGAVVVGVRSGSYPDVVLDERTGLLADRDEASLAARIAQALDMSEAQRDRIRRRAAARVATHHDFARNTRQLLAAAIGGVREARQGA